MRNLFLLSCTLVWLLTSCNNHYHYSPNTLHIPYASEQGQGAVTALLGGDPNTLSGEVKLAYSPIKHGTVMLNYFGVRSDFREYNFFTNQFSSNQIRGQFLEIGGGGYIPSFFGTAALYAGGGMGYMNNEYGLARYSKLRLNRLFMQPTFTFKNDWLRLGMGVRVVCLNFPSGDVDYAIDQINIDQILRLEKEGPFWLAEFGGNIGFYFHGITFTANALLAPAPYVYDYGFDPFNVNIGLSYEFSVRDKKKKGKD